MGGNSMFIEGKDVVQQILSGSGLKKVRGHDEVSKWVNNLSAVLYSNEFSDGFMKEVQTIMRDADMLLTLIKTTNLANGAFPRKGALEDQLEVVAKLMKAKDERSAERDFFHVTINNWDTHNNLGSQVNTNYASISLSVKYFVAECKAQGIWNNVVMMSASDFGRTMTSNGAGTDHGWSGNHFILGGDVQGKQFFGKYAEHINTREYGNEQDLGRGRLIPGHPYDSILVPIALWMGVPENELDAVFPNLKYWDRSTDIHAQSAVFKNPVVAATSEITYV